MSGFLTDRLLSVVVICYRDEGNIAELLRRLKAVLAEITPRWEIIYVNDGSPDGSAEVLEGEAQRDARVTVINHSRNFGAQAAFTTGMYQALGDAVVIMDGDLQDPPEMIRDFVVRWLAGNDVVYGIRCKRSENMLRNAGYELFYRIFRKISYVNIPLSAGEFSLMDRAVVEAILAMPERDRLIRGLRAWVGFRQEGILFDRPQRFAGESNHSLFTYCLWAIKSFVSFSFFPLRIISYLTLLTFVMLLACMVIYAGLYFSNPAGAPTGFMTLLVFVLGIGTMQMFSISVISEYFGRMFEEVKARPQRVISALHNDHRAADQRRTWLGRAAGRAAAAGRAEDGTAH